MRGGTPSPALLQQIPLHSRTQLRIPIETAQGLQTAPYTRTRPVTCIVKLSCLTRRALYSTTASEPNVESTRSHHPLSISSLQKLSPTRPYIFASKTNDPYENLAIEHHLLTYSNPQSHILFTYQNQPCVVIGRNQNPWTECNLVEMAKGLPRIDTNGIPNEEKCHQPVQLVRRRSGGGAVFHDMGNLNYTVIVPNDPKGGKGFERRTHVEMVVEALQNLGKGKKSDQFRKLINYDEVKVNERNDIVMTILKQNHREGVAGAHGEQEHPASWLKVSGTAFKLTRGRALHHGTLLFSSPYISSISPLLRSPGSEYITAKGVESVRSPVANLFHPTTYRQKQSLMRRVRAGIRNVWRQTLNPDWKDDQLARDDDVTHVSTFDMTQNSSVPELNAGIEELRSEAWKWDQTPGFSFDSGRIAKGENYGFRLKFEARNSVIKSVNVLVDSEDSTEENVAHVLTERFASFFDEHFVGESLHVNGGDEKRWRKKFLDANWFSHQWRNKLCRILETCFPSSSQEVFDISPGGPPTANVQKEEQAGKTFVRPDWRAVETKVQGKNIVLGRPNRQTPSQALRSKSDADPGDPKEKHFKSKAQKPNSPVGITAVRSSQSTDSRPRNISTLFTKARRMIKLADLHLRALRMEFVKTETLHYPLSSEPGRRVFALKSTMLAQEIYLTEYDMRGIESLLRKAGLVSGQTILQQWEQTKELNNRLNVDRMDGSSMFKKALPGGKSRDVKAKRAGQLGTHTHTGDAAGTTTVRIRKIHKNFTISETYRPLDFPDAKPIARPPQPTEDEIDTALFEAMAAVEGEVDSQTQEKVVNDVWKREESAAETEWERNRRDAGGEAILKAAMESLEEEKPKAEGRVKKEVKKSKKAKEEKLVLAAVEWDGSWGADDGAVNAATGKDTKSTIVGR